MVLKIILVVLCYCVIVPSIVVSFHHYRKPVSSETSFLDSVLHSNKYSVDNAKWCSQNPTIRVVGSHSYRIQGNLQAKSSWSCAVFGVAPPNSKLLVDIRFENSSNIWPHGCSLTAWDADEAFYETIPAVVC